MARWRSRPTNASTASGSWAGTTTGAARRAAVERRVLAQDGGLEVAQPLADVDAQLVVEPAAQVVQQAERVGLPAGPVERDHELAVDALVVPVVGGELLQVPDDLLMLTQREQGLDQGELGPQPQPVQAGRLLVQERQLGHVGQRAAAPQRQRVAQVGRGGGRVGGPGAGVDVVLGQLDVGRPAVEVEHVPGRAGDDGRPAAQHLAQVGDVALQGVRDAGRRGSVPHHLDEPVDAHHVAAVQRQHRQHRPAPQSPHRTRARPVDHVDRAEQPHPHAAIDVRTRPTVHSGPRGFAHNFCQPNG